jgi:hypothetical protein
MRKSGEANRFLVSLGEIFLSRSDVAVYAVIVFWLSIANFFGWLIIASHARPTSSVGSITAFALKPPQRPRR